MDAATKKPRLEQPHEGGVLMQRRVRHSCELCNRAGQLVCQTVEPKPANSKLDKYPQDPRGPWVFRYWLCRWHRAAWNRTRMDSQRKMTVLEYVDDATMLAAPQGSAIPASKLLRAEVSHAATPAASLCVWVVVAYRYGMRDLHSYVVGAYSSEEAARAGAAGEMDYRGGKYGCEVVKCEVQAAYQEGDAPKQTHYVESPYHGMLGGGRNPADHTSDSWKEKMLAAHVGGKTHKTKLTPLPRTGISFGRSAA